MAGLSDANLHANSLIAALSESVSTHGLKRIAGILGICGSLDYPTGSVAYMAVPVTT